MSKDTWLALCAGWAAALLWLSIHYASGKTLPWWPVVPIGAVVTFVVGRLADR